MYLFRFLKSFLKASDETKYRNGDGFVASATFIVSYVIIGNFLNFFSGFLFPTKFVRYLAQVYPILHTYPFPELLSFFVDFLILLPFFYLFFYSPSGISRQAIYDIASHDLMLRNVNAWRVPVAGFIFVSTVLTTLFSSNHRLLGVALTICEIAIYSWLARQIVDLWRRRERTPKRGPE